MLLLLPVSFSLWYYIHNITNVSPKLCNFLQFLALCFTTTESKSQLHNLWLFKSFSWTLKTTSQIKQRARLVSNLSSSELLQMLWHSSNIAAALLIYAHCVKMWHDEIQTSVSYENRNMSRGKWDRWLFCSPILLCVISRSDNLNTELTWRMQSVAQH